MFSYLHTTIFPFVGNILGRVAGLASIAWEDGLRLLLGLDIDGIYYFTNLYTGVSSTLVGSYLVEFDVLDIIGEGLFLILKPVLSLVLLPSSPLWVAFLFLAMFGLMVFYVLRFFFSFVK